MLAQPKTITFIGPYNFQYDMKDPDFSRLYVEDKPKIKKRGKTVEKETTDGSDR